MTRVLVPIDGSERSRRVLGLVVWAHGPLAPLEVHLLHVQLPELPAQVQQSVQGTVGSHRRSGVESDDEAGKTLLQPFEAMLKAAGVSFRSEVRTGHIPQVIARYAADMQCNFIVMGTRGMGSTDDVLGSIARQVINLSDLPVTLVK